MTEILGDAWTQGSAGQYGGTEQALVYVGRIQTSEGRIPCIYAHGGQPGDNTVMPRLRAAPYSDAFKAAARTTMPVAVPLLGGGTTWGNQASIDAIDDVLDWLDKVDSPVDPGFEMRSDKVVLWGDSMGALTVLNWAWRNPGKVAAMVLRCPAIPLEELHARNVAGQAAAIEAAYGGLAAFNAALPIHDPMQNLAKIGPFGDRIKIWYAPADTIVLEAEVVAFGELVGATMVTTPGNHDGPVSISPDGPAMWLYSTKARKASAYWDWQRSWDDLNEVLITESANGVGKLPVSKTVVIRPGGRRGKVTYPQGILAGSNDRRFYGLPDFSAVDSEVYSQIYSGDTSMGGQQGHFHRVWRDPDTGIWQAHVAWQNLIFGVPWILNFGVWEWDDDGTLSAFETNQVGTTPGNATLDTIRIGSGGNILATSRVSNIATYQVQFNTLPRVGDVLLVADQPDATFDGPTTVLSVGTDTFTASKPGADTVSGGGGGTFGNLNRGIFPWEMRTRVVGASPATLYWKVWRLGFDEPGWDDPDQAGTAVYPSGFHSGYGQSGFLMAHPGLLTMEQGRVEIHEL